MAWYDRLIRDPNQEFKKRMKSAYDVFVAPVKSQKNIRYDNGGMTVGELASQAVPMLEGVLGRPLKYSAGYRTWGKNIHSRHRQNQAFDLTPRGGDMFTNAEVNTIAHELGKWGLGVIDERASHSSLDWTGPHLHIQAINRSQYGKPVSSKNGDIRQEILELNPTIPEAKYLWNKIKSTEGRKLITKLNIGNPSASYEELEKMVFQQGIYKKVLPERFRRFGAKSLDNDWSKKYDYNWLVKEYGDTNSRNIKKPEYTWHNPLVYSDERNDYLVPALSVVEKALGGATWINPILRKLGVKGFDEVLLNETFGEARSKYAQRNNELDPAILDLAGVITALLPEQYKPMGYALPPITIGTGTLSLLLSDIAGWTAFGIGTGGLKLLSTMGITGMGKMAIPEINKRAIKGGLVWGTAAGTSTYGETESVQRAGESFITASVLGYLGEIGVGFNAANKLVEGGVVKQPKLFSRPTVVSGTLKPSSNEVIVAGKVPSVFSNTSGIPVRPERPLPPPMPEEFFTKPSAYEVKNPLEYHNDPTLEYVNSEQPIVNPDRLKIGDIQMQRNRVVGGKMLPKDPTRKSKWQQRIENRNTDINEDIDIDEIYTAIGEGDNRLFENAMDEVESQGVMTAAMFRERQSGNTLINNIADADTIAQQRIQVAESINRLDGFSRVVNDPNTAPEERLAAAMAFTEEVNSMPPPVDTGIPVFDNMRQRWWTEHVKGITDTVNAYVRGASALDDVPNFMTIRSVVDYMRRNADEMYRAVTAMRREQSLFKIVKDKVGYDIQSRVFNAMMRGDEDIASLYRDIDDALTGVKLSDGTPVADRLKNVISEELANVKSRGYALGSNGVRYENAKGDIDVMFVEPEKAKNNYMPNPYDTQPQGFRAYVRKVFGVTGASDHKLRMNKSIARITYRSAIKGKNLHNEYYFDNEMVLDDNGSEIKQIDKAIKVYKSKTDFYDRYQVKLHKKNDNGDYILEYTPEEYVPVKRTAQRGSYDLDTGTYSHEPDDLIEYTDYMYRHGTETKTATFRTKQARQRFLDGLHKDYLAARDFRVYRGAPEKSLLVRDLPQIIKRDRIDTYVLLNKHRLFSELAEGAETGFINGEPAMLNNYISNVERPGWTRISDNKIRWGKLAGKYVSKDAFEQLSMIVGNPTTDTKTPQGQFYQAIKEWNTWRKQNKTIRSPGTVMRNVYGTMEYSDYLHVPFYKIPFSKQLQSVYAEANGYWLDGGNVTDELMINNVLGSIGSGEYGIAWRPRREVFAELLKGDETVLQGDPMRIAKRLIKLAGDSTEAQAAAYSYIDEITKIASYIHTQRNMGFTKNQALQLVDMFSQQYQKITYNSFFKWGNYEKELHPILSPKTHVSYNPFADPFMTFKLENTRIQANALAYQPLKFLKWTVLKNGTKYAISGATVGLAAIKQYDRIHSKYRPTSPYVIYSPDILSWGHSDDDGTIAEWDLMYNVAGGDDIQQWRNLYGNLFLGEARNKTPLQTLSEVPILSDILLGGMDANLMLALATGETQFGNDIYWGDLTPTQQLESGAAYAYDSIVPSIMQLSRWGQWKDASTGKQREYEVDIPITPRKTIKAKDKTGYTLPQLFMRDFMGVQYRRFEPFMDLLSVRKDELRKMTVLENRLKKHDSGEDTMSSFHVADYKNKIEESKLRIKELDDSIRSMLLDNAMSTVDEVIK